MLKYWWRRLLCSIGFHWYNSVEVGDYYEKYYCPACGKKFKVVDYDHGYY